MRALFLLCVGCGAPYLLQADQKLKPVAKPAKLFVMPLRFSDVAPSFEAAIVQESNEKWAEHVSAWNQKYQKRIEVRAGKVGIVAVTTVGEPAGDGLRLDARVIEVVKNAATALGRDHVIAEVQLRDVATGEVLRKSTIDAESRGAGPKGYTFGGRIGWASETLASAIIETYFGQ